MNIEEAKSYLKKDVGGVNLYDHISSLLLRILIEKPKNSIDLLEHLSLSFKEKGLSSPNIIAILEECEIEARKKFSELNTKFYAEEEDAPSDGAPVQDLIADIDGFEWAGVSIGRENYFRLYSNIKKLSASSGAEDLKLWGKILGREADYYIVQGISSTEAAEDEETSDTSDPIEEGGVNKYTYWVSSTPCGDWIQLPRVSAKQIVAARNIRRYFSGNLNAIVKGHPPFPGSEKVYLRAQIARISSQSTIAPEGKYILNEEGEITTNEENETNTTAKDLLNLSNWQHTSPEINVYGRCFKEEVVDEENDEGVETKDNDITPVPLLRSLTQDRNQTWISREVGGGGAHSIAVLKSLIWPGCVVVGNTAVSKLPASIYIGYGQKSTNAMSYTPPAPEMVLVEDNWESLCEDEDVIEDIVAADEEELDEGAES